MSDNLMKKLHDLFCVDDEDDNTDKDAWWNNVFLDRIEKLDKSNEYPVSQYKAFKIANEDQNLKSDFCRNTHKKISYLEFTDCTVNLINYNRELYWHVKITDGDVSWISFDDDICNKTGTPTFCDGCFGKDDFKKLQCLINAHTGQYLYYPQN